MRIAKWTQSARSRAYFYYLDGHCTDDMSRWLLAEAVQSVLDTYKASTLSVIEALSCSGASERCFHSAIYRIKGTPLCDVCLLAHIASKSGASWSSMELGPVEMSVATAVATQWTKESWTGTPISEDFTEAHAWLQKLMMTAYLCWEVTEYYVS